MKKQKWLEAKEKEKQGLGPASSSSGYAARQPDVPYNFHNAQGANSSSNRDGGVGLASTFRKSPTPEPDNAETNNSRPRAETKESVQSSASSMPPMLNVDASPKDVAESKDFWECPDCGRKDHIFGEDGVSLEASKRRLELLGQIPLNTNIRQASDSGTPVVISSPGSTEAKCYRDIGKKLIKDLGI